MEVEAARRDWHAHEVRSALRESVRALSSRGLKKSAGWASELLWGIGEGFVVRGDKDWGGSSRSRSHSGGGDGGDGGDGGGGGGGGGRPSLSKTPVRDKRRRHGSVDKRAGALAVDTKSWPAEAEGSDKDVLLIAKAYFDLDEFERCAHVLSPEGTLPSSGGAKEVFLWAYALFLVGEKRKEEEMCEVADPLEQCQISNSNLRQLRNELSQVASSAHADGYVLYLYGVVLKEMKSNAQARKVLCESVSRAPLNWSAWLDLAMLCTEKVDVDELELPEHWMVGFFRAHLALELQQNDEAAEMLDDLGVMFPSSSYLLAQKALAQYNLRNFDEAQEHFEELTAHDPHRLQNMDTYSNILYVKELKAELSYLAHTAVRNNKYRPETCCVVGNYYSLKAQHERAVIYFKRALRLDRKYLSAWTLMGHEFVEMKNTSAAIEAYRSAVDINPRDYRAFYGLGQVHEVLNMPFFALHYFRKSATLRPYDARMWCALAGCYEKLHRVQEAIKCYKRAEAHNDREGIAAQHLAILYSEHLHDREQAAYYYKKHLARRHGEDAMGGQDAVDALRFLAGYYLKDAADLGEAVRYAEMLLDYTGPEKKEAEAMLREIRQLRSTSSSSSSSSSSSAN